jgi:hypothetical protein
MSYLFLTHTGYSLAPGSGLALRREEYLADFLPRVLSTPGGTWREAQIPPRTSYLG